MPSRMLLIHLSMERNFWIQHFQQNVWCRIKDLFWFRTLNGQECICWKNGWLASISSFQHVMIKRVVHSRITCASAFTQKTDEKVPSQAAKRLSYESNQQHFTVFNHYSMNGCTSLTLPETSAYSIKWAWIVTIARKYCASKWFSS
jgi:hypothetical protein